MYSYLVCGGTLIVLTGAGLWIYQNLPQVAITLIDAYVEMKYAICPPSDESENLSEVTSLHATEHYVFVTYGNFVAWDLKDPLTGTPQPPRGNLTGELPLIKILRGAENLSEKQQKELLFTLKQFAGPNGDFGDRLPTCEVISEFVEFDVPELLLTNELLEEFKILKTQ